MIYDRRTDIISRLPINQNRVSSSIIQSQWIYCIEEVSGQKVSVENRFLTIILHIRPIENTTGSAPIPFREKIHGVR